MRSSPSAASRVGPRFGRRGAALLLLVALAGGAVGCGDPAPAGAFDPDQPATGPLTALSDCGPLPTPADAEVPDGAQLPDGAVLTSAIPQGPLVNVTAEVRATPVSIRLAYEARDDLELIIVEDEVFESELLVSDGVHRTYIKASAVCATGSTLLAIVSPEDGGDALPVPTGAASGG
jgi:hypothetical protein